MKKFILLFLIMLIMPSVFAIEEETEVLVPDFQDPTSNFVEITPETTRFQLGTEKLFSQKKIEFRDNFFDDLQFGINFKGPINFNIRENGLQTTFPFAIEPYVHTHFGENKNEFRLSVLPTREIQGIESQFFEKISDFYYIRHFNPRHSILIGQSRVPIGYEGGQSFWTLPFANRSQLASNFGNARALGVRLMGDFGYVDYDIGGYSSTRYLQQVDKGLEFVSWFNYKPFHKYDESILKNLKIGAGLNYGRNDGQYTVLSTGFKWDYQKWLLSGEYGFANGFNGSRMYREDKAQGFNATLGYYITDKLQILGRFDYFNPYMEKDDTNVQQYTLGANYYIFKERLRLTGNYIFEQNKKQGNKNIVILVLQFMI